MEKEYKPMSWYLSVLQKYTVFSGRARRQEYWMFTLFSVIISFVLSIIDQQVLKSSPGILSSLYSLAVLSPSLAVSARRLHDTGRSGWWILISLVPVIGWIVIIYFLVQDSEAGDNKYGPNPKLAAV